MPTFVIVNKMYLTIENPQHLHYEADAINPTQFGYIFVPNNMFEHAQVPEGMEYDCIRAVRIDPTTETVQTSHIDEETGETIITTQTIEKPASFYIAVHEQKLARKRAIQWNALRDERNKRLALCDWTQLPDAQLKFTEQQKEEWRAYRQALRDIPLNTAHPANPVWPTEPGYIPPQPIPEVPEEPLVMQPEFLPPPVPEVIEPTPVVDPTPTPAEYAPFDAPIETPTETPVEAPTQE